MAQNLTLVEGPAGQYTLGDPSSDVPQRLRDRVRVQLLSLFRRGRGSFLLSEIRAGRVRTNADIVGLFGLTAAYLVDLFRQVSQDQIPDRLELQGFEVLPGTQVLRLSYTIYYRGGSVDDQILIEEE